MRHPTVRLARQPLRRSAVLVLCFLAACSRKPHQPLQTVHDLVALFPVAEVRTEVSGIDFGTRDARAALVSGWSRNEAGPDGLSYVWSQGEASVAEVFLAAARDLQMAIRCAPFDEQQSIEVEANGHAVGQVALTPGMREYIVSLPAQSLRAGRNLLIFHYGHVSAASAATGHRRIAVQWDALRFRAVRQPDPPRSEAGAVWLPFGTGLVYFLDVPDEGELALPRIEARGATGGHLEIAVQEEDGKTESHEMDPVAKPRIVDLPDHRLVRLALRAVPASPGAGGGLWVQAPAVLGAREARPAEGVSDEKRRPRSWSGHPNVIVYLVDALRRDRLGCYGAARPLSPAIDAFARGATLFERAVAQSTWTRPSVTSLLTGLGPHAHGVQTLDDRLPDAAVTLPELLHGGGYRTAAFSTNLHVSAATGLAQGFDDFDLMADAPASDEVNRHVLAWLDAHSGASPFFLYIHTLDPHAPYDPPVEMLQRFAPGVLPAIGTHEEIIRTFAMPSGEERNRRVEQLKALYDAEVAANDRSFGELMAELKRRGLYDSSLIVFLADHGEEHDEHGFLGHANNLYAETLDVPLVVKWPGQTVGEKVPALAQQVDLLPTLLRAAGLQPPAGLPGSDLFTLSSLSAAPGRQAFSHLRYDGRDGMSVVTGGWKLILPFSRKLGNGPELYRRATDPGDQNDLAASDEVRAGWMQSQIRLELLRTRPPEAAPAPVDPETKKALEALGYQ